jgi:hypothetical protein
MVIPQEIAEEFIESGEAVPSLMTRGVGDVVQILIEVVGTGDSAITVAVAATAVPRVMRTVAARVRDQRAGAGGQVLLRRGGRDVVVDLPVDVSLDDAAAVLQRTFAEATSQSA